MGNGRTWLDNLLLVALAGAEIVGAAAAAPAIYQDHGLRLPWWTIDVVAVAPPWHGSGAGRALIKAIYQRAVIAEVTSLYGLCAEHLTGWYTTLVFSVTGPGAELQSNVKLNGSDLRLRASKDECWFLSDMGTPGPRLYLPA